MKKGSRILLLSIAATLPFIASLLYFVLLSGHPVAQGIYSLTKVFTLAWPFVFFRWLAKEPLPPFVFSKNLSQSIISGVFTGALMVGGLLALYYGTSLGQVVREASPQIRSKAVALGVLEYYVPFALFLSLVHSLIEEYFWRWFVYGEIARVLGHTALAHMLAGLAFALHHVVVTTQFFPLEYGLLFGLSVGLGGMIWSVLFAKQGSVLGAWISHALVDLGILGVGYGLLFP